MSVPKPNSREHDKLKSMMMRRLQMAENQLSSRHDSWKKAERAYRLFVAPEEVMEPKEPIASFQESLYPYPTSVVIPMSYAIAQTLIAFWITQFTGQLPYIRVGNRNPESYGPAKAQELLLSYQLEHLGYIPTLYYWFLDALRYGQGIAKVFWDVKEREQTIRSTISIPALDGPVTLPINRKQRIMEYEGNAIEIIDPFTWRPDPRVPIARFQDGLFCGESIYRAYFSLLKKQRDGLYENVEEIPFIGRAGSEMRGATDAGSLGQSDRDRIMQANRFFGIVPDDEDKGMVLVDEMAIDLIPRDVGVGTSDEVQRYFVTMGNRTTIIRAEEYPYDHEEFVYSVIESSPDIHSLMNPGIMELMEPIAQHISWLFNSHIENVRKSLNDMTLVDPSRINMDDLLNPSAGKTIRLAESAWGGGLDGVMQQFPVVDVTRGNVETALQLNEVLQRFSSATDAVQGQSPQTKGGRARKTAMQFNVESQQAGLRLRMQAKMFSAQGLVPLARQMVQNNQSFMSEERYLKIMGSLEQEYQGIGRAVSGRGVIITPEDIQGQFDFPVFDGGTPLDPVRFAETWMNLASLAMQNPVLAQRIDHVQLFKQIAGSLGVTDVARFLLPQQAQVMPDQQVEQQVQQGNLVPQPNGAAGPPPGTMMQ